MSATDFHQWTTAQPLLAGGSPPWASQMDQIRIGSYMLYEQIYWTVPNAFKMVLRGDTNAIYIPSGRQIVETMHRYLAPSLLVMPDTLIGTEADQTALFNAWEVLRRKERFYSKFSSAKRFGLIRGDFIFQIEADPELPPGARISIREIDPGSYFPIESEDDPDIRVGARLAYQFVDEQGTAFVQTLTYRKATNATGPSPITIEEVIQLPDNWPDGPTERVIQPLTELPPVIDAIPIYHFPNFTETASPWGSSEMRGIERIMTSINQVVSDEDITLILNGLGVYTTDAGAPIDPDTGQTMDWVVGPAKVLEMPPNTSFNRVTGVSSVMPYQEHLGYIHEQLDQTFGISATAKGRVDVSVAESGVALALDLGPIITRSEEKELILTDVLSNFLWDMRKWFNAYEQLPLFEATLLPLYGDKIPPNRRQKFDEAMQMYNAGIVSGQWVRDELEKIGYTFPEATEMMDQIIAEKQIMEDVTGARMDRDIASAEVSSNGQGEPEPGTVGT